MTQASTHTPSMNKASSNQEIIEALQELNSLLDEEAQQGYDPEDKELWARVCNRIDTIDYAGEQQTAKIAINPAPVNSPQLELVAPHGLATQRIQDSAQPTAVESASASRAAQADAQRATQPSSLNERISDLLAQKLSSFGHQQLTTDQQNELVASLQRLLNKE